MCSNNITKQKFILNDYTDYIFCAKIFYRPRPTVILENALSVDMKNSWNRSKSPHFTVSKNKYCYWIQINTSFQQPTERLVSSAAQHRPTPFAWYSIDWGGLRSVQSQNINWLGDNMWKTMKEEYKYDNEFTNDIDLQQQHNNCFLFINYCREYAFVIE